MSQMKNLPMLKSKGIFRDILHLNQINQKKNITLDVKMKYLIQKKIKRKHASSEYNLYMEKKYQSSVEEKSNLVPDNQPQVLEDVNIGHKPIHSKQEQKSIEVPSIDFSEKEINEEKPSENPKNPCIVCLEKEIHCIFEPCYHICCCLSCAFKIEECPKCRTKIKVKKVFID